ncbi:MAG: Na-translocating system protein MpsC family protein [Planctomycetia bacterium]
MEKKCRSVHTDGQAEALACEIVNQCLQRMIGRGAGTVSATLTPCCLYVHLRDVLTTAERSLASTDGNSRTTSESLVREVRDRLVRQARGELAATLAASLGRHPQSVLHDVDPTTGDEVVVFTFAQCGTARGRRSDPGPHSANGLCGTGSA